MDNFGMRQSAGSASLFQSQMPELQLSWPRTAQFSSCGTSGNRWPLWRMRAEGNLDRFPVNWGLAQWNGEGTQKAQNRTQEAHKKNSRTFLCLLCSLLC